MNRAYISTILEIEKKKERRHEGILVPITFFKNFCEKGVLLCILPNL